MECSLRAFCTITSRNRDLVPLKGVGLKSQLLIFLPQSLRDSPGGVLGTVFPRPLASLRTACALHSNPQSLRDSPGGALGTVFPRSLASLRTACALHSNPQSLRDSPGGALGTVFPRPLASLRSWLFINISVIDCVVYSKIVKFAA